MKVVILAGGMGTRLSEETLLKPKPMVEICGKPILWHIMKIYSSFGFNDFIICLGYKGYMIKEYFYHYYLYQSDIAIDLKNNAIEYINSKSEPWKITLVDTGLNTLTGSRIKKIKSFLKDETFMLTYGDGVADIDINKLIDFHKKSGKIATLTAVKPLGRFGALNIDNASEVKSFREKPDGEAGWINGGFFVLEKEIFNYIGEGENISWEGEPLEKIAKDNGLSAYKHEGFWKPMDTLREKNELENLYINNKAPWKIWKD
ncbi:MAG: glucose-1-phosphate cytidylyltransferase [Spirochaetes bacterium]|nr:glucose-1-phosphate cytidylyltransferase [Spirochaetota bacterium]